MLQMRECGCFPHSPVCVIRTGGNKVGLILEGNLGISCLRRQLGHGNIFIRRARATAAFRSAACLPQENGPTQPYREDEAAACGDEQSGGAMSRRLSELTEDIIEHGGHSARKAMDEAGFSEELRQRLEAKIADSNFRSENPAAFASLDMPSAAGRGTWDHAAAQPWTGTETVEDAALRMLNDAHKPVRGTGPPRIPQPRSVPMTVDMRMKKAVQKSRGERLANARDRTSVYALTQNSTLSEKEREEMRKVLKERFTAGARPMPGTVQGLAALANERIEDAIARGQFKNIARGKGKNIERDYTASSPFLDTTEYFMNKIIQKQDIVPPWIEKQQELVKETQTFRSRLRNDWKRHAARVIASKGGPIESQVRRAEAYAAAEAAQNPKKTKVEALSEIDMEGRLSQVTVTETTTTKTPSDPSATTITISEDLACKTSQVETLTSVGDAPETRSQTSTQQTPPAPPLLTNVSEPFRDPDWESLESSYHNLAISSLNSLTRSYNLMAPDLAKKPYFSLDRELRACFADVAPLLPLEIRDRARRPGKIRVEVVGHRPGGVLEKFGGGEKVQVYDSTKPLYGFKQFWRDLWGRAET
ncbi:MAG: hypothetical protein LQ341_001242 [Variospora aurantia]|nr:MAG: hypothetical protein LQ341_001242 [Variospora aurantia]